VQIRSSILIVGLILSVVCFVGCKRKSEPTKAEVKSTKPNVVQQVTVDSNVVSPNVPAKADAGQIVATVNGVSIFRDDFDKKVEQQISPVQRQMPAAFLEQYKKELDKKVLDEMIVDILLAGKAKEKGIVVTEQEIDGRINEVAQRQKMTLKDFREMLKAKGEDFNQFRDKVRQNLVFEKLVEAESGPIQGSDANDTQKKRMELTGQYLQKLKSAAKITYASP
jgi:parvulin-like peptidyl-prolyl isomerase